MFPVLLSAVGRLKKLKAAYDAHAAATGTSVHGLGDLATMDDLPRNRLINGCFRLARRGGYNGYAIDSTGAIIEGSAGARVAALNNNDGKYCLDRWVLLSDGNDVVDVWQEVTLANLPAGVRYGIALDVETVNKKFGILQIVEYRNCNGMIGVPVVASFKAAVSSTAKLDNVKCAILAWTGTADSPTKDVVSSWGVEGTNPTLVSGWEYVNTPANLNVGTTWATYQVTGTTPSQYAGSPTTPTSNLAVLIWSDVTDTNLGEFLRITEAKFEPGSVATPFEYRPYQDEWLAASRYFYIGSSDGRAYTSDSYLGATWAFPCEMRTVPTPATLTIANGTATYNGGWLQYTRFGGGYQFAPGVGTFYWYGAYAYFDAEIGV